MSLSSLLLRFALPAVASAAAAGYAALAAATPHQAAKAPAPVTPAPTPPAVRREFRGVWVSTVANIDWPSKPGLSVTQQRTELIALLDRAKQLGLNGIVFQVRPACDALYASKIEPWSEYLTGTMGKAPDPFYDPLEFAVTEAHKRGLELHAWFNPYRARHAGSSGKPASPDHVSRKYPELVRQYGKWLWLDPGDPAVREYSLSVILDVVKRYDIDGIHIDDYFYPYKEQDASGADIDFPDAATYQKYVAAGGTLDRDDWRRDSVNQFVQQMYTRVKAEKPWVKVGISPFGIWRPGNPAQIQGLDAYSQLYADSKKWLNEGWCDYFTPQLYWAIAQTPQSYPVLLSWWLGENTKGRQIWPGQYTSRASEGGTFPPEEIEYQIRVTRGFAGATGTVHFSAEALNSTAPDAVGPRLASTVYAEPALIPAFSWMAPAGTTPPAAPQKLTSTPITRGGGFTLAWKAGDTRPVWQWVLQTRAGGKWTTTLLPGTALLTATAPAGADYVSLYAVDRYGAAGTAAVIPLASGAVVRK